MLQHSLHEPSTAALGGCICGRVCSQICCQVAFPAYAGLLRCAGGSGRAGDGSLLSCWRFHGRAQAGHNGLTSRGSLETAPATRGGGGRRALKQCVPQLHPSTMLIDLHLWLSLLFPGWTMRAKGRDRPAPSKPLIEDSAAAPQIAAIMLVTVETAGARACVNRHFRRSSARHAKKCSSNPTDARE